jgi:hypothetical protein
MGPVLCGPFQKGRNAAYIVVARLDVVAGSAEKLQVF